MKHSITSPTAKHKLFCAAGAIILIALAVTSLFVGKCPLAIDQLLAGNEMHWRVFVTLRCSRTIVGVVGGFALGVAGFIYQTVFRNPLASPDIIGVSSGASAGAAAGILFLSGGLSVTLSVFMCLRQLMLIKLSIIPRLSLAVFLSFLACSAELRRCTPPALGFLTPPAWSWKMSLSVTRLLTFAGCCAAVVLSWLTQKISVTK